jgi:serine/threonine protein kinase
MLLSIEFMHNKGMWHRDLKPDNIFVEDLGKIIHFLKIGDFGCVRQNKLDGINNIT